MSSKATSQKRKAAADSNDEAISPPPLKRKIQSTTNKNAVASFFTPASQKGPERTTWRSLDDSLLVAKYTPEITPGSEEPTAKRRKVAAFDLDGTLITTASGKTFSADPSDWKWWDPCVPGELRKLHDDGHQVIIVTNQGRLNLAKDSKTAKTDQKRVSDFKSKVNAVLSSLDLPTSVYAATQKDRFRKPRDGMWKEILDDYDLDEDDVVGLEGSMFVGDAAGREKDEDGMGKKDFACSDRDFAANAGIKFLTPEEYFLKSESRAFKRSFDPAQYLKPKEGDMAGLNNTFARQNKQDVVVLCGSPGVGKSTFYWKQLEPLGYERVNQDILKKRDKCLEVAEDILQEGKSVAVDNTNADKDTRAHWIKLAKRVKVPARCVHLQGDPKLCEHNDTVRALAGAQMNPESRAMLPAVAFTGYASRFQPPRAEEGFQDVFKLDFEFKGSEEQKAVWSRYWI